MSEIETLERAYKAERERDEHLAALEKVNAKLAALSRLSPNDWEMIGDALADHSERWEEAIAHGGQSDSDAWRPRRAKVLIGVVDSIARELGVRHLPERIGTPLKTPGPARPPGVSYSNPPGPMSRRSHEPDDRIDKGRCAWCGGPSDEMYCGPNCRATDEAGTWT